MGDMGEDLARLKREFCPLLEEALVTTIYSDYQGVDNCVELARAVLATFHASAAAEQLSGFDASGCSTQRTEQGHGDWTSPPDTDVSSLTDGVCSLGISSTCDSTLSEANASLTWPQNLDASAKEAYLIDTFPSLDPADIAFVLKKNKGDLDWCTDELLNHVLFDELDGQDDQEQQVPRKGVDAFFSVNNAAACQTKYKRKHKRNAKRGSLDAHVQSNAEPTAPLRNAWETISADVDFIASRVNVSPHVVKSLYHACSRSIAATITALIEQDIAINKKLLEEEDDTMVGNVLELAAEFRLEQAQAHALVRLARHSTAAAHELAKALARGLARNTSNATATGIQVIPHYVSLNLSDDESSASRNVAPPTPTSPQYQASAASLSAARDAAFTKATEYYRRGKSDPLMKAAASYYGQLGRQAHRACPAAAAAQADALVAAQSSPTQLDLHGVSVKDAERIAHRKVADWWDSLGEDRIKSYAAARGRINEYRIITGMGRHSDGGKAKIGPAVMRMLIAEGWKVEDTGGVLVVTGMKRMQV